MYRSVLDPSIFSSQVFPLGKPTILHDDSDGTCLGFHWIMASHSNLPLTYPSPEIAGLIFKGLSNHWLSLKKVLLRPLFLRDDTVGSWR